MEGYERYVGQVLDNRYRIERIIGMGGMAVVFRAEDLLMRRIVAVKILKRRYCARRGFGEALHQRIEGGLHAFAS